MSTSEKTTRAASNGHDEESLVPRTLDFDDSLEPTEVKFKYKNEDYVAVEAPHAVARKWRSAALAAHVPTPDGGLLPGPDYPNTDAILVADCIFKINPVNQTREPVKLETVVGWPNRVTRKLYETIRTISMLTERDLSTPDLVQKEIHRLQKLLTKMQKEGEGAGGPAGNSQGAGTGNSA
jgi:hypothetical protein